MRGLLSKKTKNSVILFVILIIVVISSPYWIWYLKESKPLEVLIVDKTVPDRSFREHKGLVWILNHEKYLKNSHTPYSVSNDYSGFLPLKNKQFKTKEIPNDLGKFDVIYLADHYGVYENDIGDSPETGERSDSIYGGLQEKEIEKIEKALLRGNKTLVAEFNTFGSPTAEKERRRISTLLNLDWTGWIGRYFPNLQGEEVPNWVKDNYSKKTGKWNFTGEGFVFVDKNDFVVVIGKEEITGGRGANFSFSKAGQNQFDMSIDTEYQYWFDIVQARNQNEVLALYHLPLTSKAKDKLLDFGIPATFPAIISHKNVKYSSYYFAGDFADEAEVPAIYQTSGLDLWKQHFGAENSFYWSAYVPIMKQLLEKGLHSEMKQESITILEDRGISTNSRVGEKYIEIQKNGKWEDFLVKGVNMGIAKPGYFPGEAAITKDEYLRWFKAIGDMNANTIRVYTLHPPAFYEAFFEYNQLAEKPIFLMHGAWINEEELISSQDAFSDKNVVDFQNEIKQMIDIIHGKAEIPPRKGHASGKYTHDISKYVLGFILGIEWDPNMVFNTNQKHKGIKQFTGHYFKTANASPFEIWLATMMEFTADYETKRYGWQHTMSFTNWVTTDLLKHPAEPLAQEDLVTVNPNHISSLDRFQAGIFASYHIYPYYPDFMNHEDEYIQYKDSSGKKNNYAGYLNDLIQEHTMPVVVAEFGVPSSRGLTHRNVHGMNQGHHSEKDQGKINAKLFRSIVSEGYAGGMVFAWQDEWFKRTWNTMDYDDPDRRPYWSNIQTNEQYFGLMSFEPGKEEKAIFVDGRKEDWKKAGIESIYKNERQSFLNDFRVSSDEKYFYLMMDYKKPINWENHDIFLLVDTMDHQGQKEIALSENVSVKSDYGIDFLIGLKDEKNSSILVDSYYDSFYYQYGKELKMIDSVPYAQNKNNGIFHPMNLALNKELTIPEKNIKIPFQAYETGVLKYGTSNPSDKNYNSLTDISISRNKKIIEVRIPWQLLNVKDPSLKTAMADMWKEGLTGSIKIEGVRIALALTENKKLIGSIPKTVDETLHQRSTFLYRWDEWNEPSYFERLKESYYLMQDVYRFAGTEGEKK